MDAHRRFALAAVGVDRPGIVAGVAAALLAHDGNVEDSRMAILRGRFAMVLVVALPAGADDAAVRAGLDAARAELGLDALTLHPLGGGEPGAPVASHVVSVYGADHPGIVHAVARALAAHGATITDLTTHLTAELYAMLVEAAVPPGHEAALAGALDAVAADQGVELTLAPLDADAL